jgi:protein-L-isoaspartate(D-aspartate) O-methyltransferase
MTVRANSGYGRNFRFTKTDLLPTSSPKPTFSPSRVASVSDQTSLLGHFQGADMKLTDLRRVYARQVLTLANAFENVSLEAAYATVPRETFLGSGEWRINTPWSVGALIPNDPILIYQDVVVALDRERGVNNGSPSLHAHWLDVVAPGPGERVMHIGAGTGYYSAILAELVGDEGRVMSIEFDAALAARAQRNLADRSNVACIEGNGFDWPQAAVDVVYVNFAASRPARSWVENLNVGGRLVFPLGVPRAATPMIGQGLNAVALLVTRHIGGYSAKALGRVSFVYAESEKANVPQEEIDALCESLQQQNLADIKTLFLDKPQASSSFWFAGSDWGLSTEEFTESRCN